MSLAGASAAMAGDPIKLGTGAAVTRYWALAYERAH
jgi:hypothetical protein